MDSIAYFLQPVALNLLDTISACGTEACAICDVKPPLYPPITEKLEKALATGLSL